MDPDMKIIFIVCDNSRRALSRYFHLANMGKSCVTMFQRFYFVFGLVNVVGNNVEKNQVKLDDCGQSFEEFDNVIGCAADDLYQELATIRDNIGATSFTEDAFIKELFTRYVNRDDPFKLQ